MRLIFFLLFLVSCATRNDEHQFRAVVSYQQAMEEARQGNISEAVSQLEDAVRYEPSFPEAWFNLGVGYEKVDEIDHALYAYSKAASLDPQFIEARLGMLDCHVTLDQYREAKLIIDHLPELELPEVHLKKQHVFDHLSLDQQAISEGKKVLNLNPFDFKTAFWMGQKYFNLKVWDQAEDAFSVALAIRPLHQETLSYLQKIESKKNRSGKGP